MNFRYALAAALLCTSVPAIGKEDQTVLVASEDQEMNEAIAQARATLDEFLRIKANPPAGASDFKIKVQITDAHGSEHMWVTPFELSGQGFSGVLANEPEYVTSVKNGQTIRFSREDVSDWGYALNGKQKGSFTVCVVFKHLPAHEVEHYRRENGFEC